VRFAAGVGEGVLEKEGEALTGEAVGEGVEEGVGLSGCFGTGVSTATPSPPRPDAPLGQHLLAVASVQPPTPTPLAHEQTTVPVGSFPPTAG
jgi:hypothetical protein